MQLLPLFLPFPNDDYAWPDGDRTDCSDHNGKGIAFRHPLGDLLCV